MILNRHECLYHFTSPVIAKPTVWGKLCDACRP